MNKSNHSKTNKIGMSQKIAFGIGMLGNQMLAKTNVR